MKKMSKKDSNARDKIVFGKAMNWTECCGGCHHFERIGLTALEQLLALGMLDLDECQNSSPSIGDFMEFLKKHPGAFAHGYVISPSRDDCRVSLEGIGCEPGSVTVAMKSDFIDLCREADEFEHKNGLYAWWD